MCGIYGITENNPSIIKKMIDVCSHRGPDGSNTFNNDYLTLGHNLLSITSNPSNAIQPWISESGNVLVFNGEIFNYKQLLKRFNNQFIPKSSCDTELLSWLLDNFSYEDVISNFIDSMHAFAFFNKNKNELVLSRDHVGIKPLYFCLNQKGLIFSSEIKGLIETTDVSKKINRLGLACTCFLGVNVLRETLFSGIQKVLPGETIIYDLEKKNIKRTINTLIHPTSNAKLNLEEFRHQTNLALENSTLGIRKFGLFLSGGIDSSLIANHLNNFIPNLNSYTNFMDPNEIIQGEDHNSDANVAKKLSKDLKLKHHEIRITPEIITEYWNDSIKTIEEPVYSWNLPMYLYTNEYLSKQGTVVTMAGDIGDEIFGGYSKYFYYNNLQNPPKNWSEFISLWMKKFSAPVKLNLNFTENELHEVLLKALPESLFNPDDIANSAMALDSITTVSEDFFKRNDRYGMKYSMEGRFPFSSKEYMKYCMSINSRYKIGKNVSETKLPVKQAYGENLPNYILSKQKTGWSVPITKWVETQEVLKQKYIIDINSESPIDQILSSENFKIDPKIGPILSNKRSIISWSFKTWSSEFKMHL